jgi:hypothetical protein
MPEEQKTKPSSRSKRPSISVTGKTYERLRAAYPTTSLAAFVDDMIVKTLNDPAACARLAALCQRADALS